MGCCEVLRPQHPSFWGPLFFQKLSYLEPDRSLLGLRGAPLGLPGGLRGGLLGLQEDSPWPDRDLLWPDRGPLGLQEDSPWLDRQGYIKYKIRVQKGQAAFKWLQADFNLVD